MRSSSPDISSLNYHDASEYRRELLHALRNPGLEFEVDDEASAELYRQRVAAVDAHLKTLEPQR